MTKILRWLPILAILVLAAGLFGWQQLQAYWLANPSSPIANLDERLVDELVLDNGLQVYLISDAKAKNAYWHWQGPASRGVVALAERPYQNTTIKRYVTSLGGQWQAFSGMAETNIKASGRDPQALLDMLASLVADPAKDYPSDWRGAAIRNQRPFTSDAKLVVSSALSLADMRAQLPASLTTLSPAQPNGAVELGLTRTLDSLDVAARMSIPVTNIGSQPIEQALATLADYSPAPTSWQVEQNWLHFEFANADDLSQGIAWFYALSQQWPNFARFQNALGCYTNLSDRLLRLGASGAMQSCLTADPALNFSSDQIAIALRGTTNEDRVTPASTFSNVAELGRIWPERPLPIVAQTFSRDPVVTSTLYRQQLSLVHQDDAWAQWHRQSEAPVSQLFVAWQLQEADLASAQLLAAAINAPGSVNQQLSQRHVLVSAELVNAQLQVSFIGPAQEIAGAVNSWLLWLSTIDGQFNLAQAQLSQTPVKFLQQQPAITAASELTSDAWLGALQTWLFSRPMLAMHDGPLDQTSVSEVMQVLRRQLEGAAQPQGGLHWQLNEPTFLLTEGGDTFRLNLPRQDYSEAAQQLMLQAWLEDALRDYGLAQSPQLQTQVEQWRDVLRVSIAADTDPGLLELHWRRFISRLAEQVKAIEGQQFDAWRMGLAESVARLPESPVLQAQLDWQAVSRGYVHLDERLRHKTAITQMSQDRFVRWLETLAESDRAALWHHQYSGQFGSYNKAEFATDRREINDPFVLLDWDAEAKLSPSLLVRD
ncbi:hypothetical protein [Salinibius halmophilus]|uniref:hypothetical protein n=1 Tax=Salinibius halmophilus TaxID=1853216 RepID=UPI000E66D950|nr:hypothetical protein [Salinibius halmophilus]